MYFLDDPWRVYRKPNDRLGSYNILGSPGSKQGRAASRVIAENVRIEAEALGIAAAPLMYAQLREIERFSRETLVALRSDTLGARINFNKVLSYILHQASKQAPKA